MRKVPAVVTLDFETEAIARRPNYPPRPVGLAIKFPGDRRAQYLTEKDEMVSALRRAWKSGYSILCHNSKFDTDVAETYLQFPRLPALRLQDTLYLLFLHDPHATSLSLKPAAEKILGLPPEERDAVRDWLVGRGIVKKNQKDWGAYICDAPPELVGPYAIGDVERTEGLFKKLYPEIVGRGMREAYEREQKLMPILLDSEREGIRVDLRKMETDYARYGRALLYADAWLRLALKAPGLNLDADLDLGEALDRAGIVTDWTWTAGGKGRAPQRSVSKKNLSIERFKNREVALVHAYRVRLSTCLSMFFEPWLAMAREGGGRIFTNWNQVRQSHGNDSFAGARTGRLSSNPNLQNVPKVFEDKDDGYEHPEFIGAVFLRMGLPPLPLMRRYLLPDGGGVWGHRDFNQQELRVLAHFEDGLLAKHYNDEPRFDIHTTVQTALREQFGITLTRGGTKIVNFSDVYGKGLVNLAESLKVSVETVKLIRAGKNALMPGVELLTQSVKLRGASGKPIRTWGGREYFTEAPAYSKKFGRRMTFEYKLLNYLVQGSSADLTKEAVIRYAAHPRRRARFLLTVHDELNASFPRGAVKAEMEVLREVMETIELGVPLLSDGKTGPNWADLKKWED